MVVRSLLTILGFKADTGAARSYENIMRNIVNITKIAVRATKELAMAVLNTAGEFEQAEVALSTMLRSQEKATELLKEVTDFAAKTPFKLTELTEQTKALVSFRVEAQDVIPTLENLGNVAAIVGVKKLPNIVQAFGRVKLMGRATMRELKTFITAGVPIMDELADTLGVTTGEVSQLVRAGKIGFKEVQAAIENMNKEGGIAFNAMIKQSKTFFGLLSMVDDQFTQIKLEAGRELLPIVKELVEGLRAWLEENRAIIVSGIVKFLKTVAKFIAFIFFFIRRLWKNLKDKGVIDAIGKAFDTALTIAGGFLKVIIEIISFLSQFHGLIEAIVIAVIAWKVAQGALNLIMAANPIGLIITAVAALIAIIVLLVKNWDNVVRFIKELWDKFVGFWKGLWEGIKNAMMAALNFLKKAWEKFVGFLEDFVFRPVSDFFKGVAEALGGGEAAFEQVVKPAGPTQADILAEGLRGTMTGAGNNVNVDSTINLGLPAGTPEETRRAAAEGAAEGARNEWNLILEGGLINSAGGKR